MADTVPSEAALRLQARLKELGWKAADLAEKIDVSPAVVSRWLASKRVPSLEMAFKIQNSEVALPAEIWLANPTAEVPPDAPTAPLIEDDAGGSGEHKRIPNDADATKAAS